MEDNGHKLDQSGIAAEAGFLDYLIIFAKHKTIVIGVPMIAGLITAAATLLVPNTYVATARILPPQQSESSALAMLSQIGSIVGLPSGLGGTADPKDLYVGMLKSRVIADRVIDIFQLKKLYEDRSWVPFVEFTQVEMRERLADAVKFTAGDEGIISIKAEDQNAKLAADIANTFVQELDKLSQNLAIGEAGQRRLYFERQVQDAKAKLVAAESGLQKVQERTGMLVLDEQGKKIIEIVAEVRARIAAKEVELAAMRSFATAQNPDYIRARKELAGMRAELGKLEQNEVMGNGDIMVPTGKLPDVGVGYVRALREVKYSEMLYELLLKQYELARTDEAKSMPVIKIIDPAVPLDEKTKPHRTLIVLIVSLLAGLLGVMWVIVIEGWGRMTRDQHQIEKLARLRNYLQKGWRISH